MFFCELRPVMATRAPARFIPCAIPSPSPPLPPVTRAVSPCSEKESFLIMPIFMQMSWSFDRPFNTLNSNSLPHHDPSGTDVKGDIIEAFRDAESYYATLGMNSSIRPGIPMRVARDLGRKAWGDEGYAREELGSAVPVRRSGADAGSA